VLLNPVSELYHKGDREFVMKTGKIIMSVVLMISLGLFSAQDVFAAKHLVLNSHRARMEFVLGLLITDILIGVYFYATDSKVSNHHLEPEQSEHGNNSSESNSVINILEDQISSPGGVVLLRW
jgi:hypothetical protein